MLQSQSKAKATLHTLRAPVAPARRDSVKSVLNVMSFNIRNSSASDGIHSWANRRDLAMGVLNECNPDLVGFQEVLPDQFEDLQWMSHVYAFHGAPRDDGQHVGERALIGYRLERFQLIEAGDFWLTERSDRPSLGWDASHIRICSWVRLLDRSVRRPLLFANTHWDHKGRVARQMSAQLMRARLSELSRGSAVIVAGDLNSHETDDCVRTLLLPDSSCISLVDAYRHVHPQRQPNEETSHHFTQRTEGMRIDYILHSAGVRALDAAIVRSRGPNGEFPTDHFPVTCCLKWEDEQLA